MKYLFFSLLSVFLSLPLSAQLSLDRLYNMPRVGDRLIKQQVDYQAPGDADVQVVWDFSDPHAVNDHYELRYDSLGSLSDTLVGTENRTMYYYCSQGDSLSFLGYENPTALFSYRKPFL